MTRLAAPNHLGSPPKISTRNTKSEMLPTAGNFPALCASRISRSKKSMRAQPVSHVFLRSCATWLRL